MVEGQSITVADVVAKTIDGRLEDFVREAVALVARELMEAEISDEIGAGLGEVAPRSADAPQRLPAEAVGDARGRARTVDPAQAPGAGTSRRSLSPGGGLSRRSWRS